VPAEPVPASVDEEPAAGEPEEPEAVRMEDGPGGPELIYPAQEEPEMPGEYAAPADEADGLFAALVHVRVEGIAILPAGICRAEDAARVLTDALNFGESLNGALVGGLHDRQCELLKVEFLSPAGCNTE
jgi:hypothetical protein